MGFNFFVLKVIVLKILMPRKRTSKVNEIQLILSLIFGVLNALNTFFLSKNGPLIFVGTSNYLF